MAKTISDEKMKLSIEINGNSAQKDILELEKAVIKLKHANSDYAYEQKMIAKQLGKDSQEYKNLTEKMKANSLEIEQSEAKLKGLISNLKLTDKTMGQLGTEASVLARKLKLLDPNSSDWKKTDADLKQINGRMQELRGNSQTAKMSISSLADGFNKYQGMALGAVAALTGVVLSIQKIIDINGKLSDAQSDVMKTTGMTKVEVDELTKSFGLLQTRTSRIDLLGIAEQGGRIGIAKAEIGDFVNVMNKASVSLGDSFTGGAEEVANKLGKIKFLFQETKDLGVEQAYNSIGSAINDLGANGTASEANIADFTTRIGSLTDVLKPTIQETLALGTAFEESGIESEVSARAYGIFMKQASTETAKFAKVMGLTQKEVETMINKNPLDFMLKFAEGMKGMSGTETAKTLDFLGISADGANKVIGAMGNNTKRFRELMLLSNNSFKDGTSLVNEYDIKNNNLAATLEKISKTVSGWFSSETFIKWLATGVDWLAKFIGATEDADGSVSAWKNTLIFTAKIIAIITAAIVTNIGWQKLVVMWTNRSTEATLLSNIAMKTNAVITAISTIAMEMWALAVAIATGDMIGAKNAINAMTLAMKTTPWGFILSAIVAIGAAYVLFSNQVSDAAEIQKTLVDVHNEATKSISKEKSELELLTKIAQDETISKEKKLKAIERLNQIIPDYIGMLSLENIKTAEGIGILKKYTAELYANARAKAVKNKFDQLNAEKLDIEAKTSKDYQSSTGQFMSKITGQDTSLEFNNRKDIEKYVLKNFSGQLNAKKDKTTGTTIVDKKLFEELVNRYMDDYGINDKEKELALKDAQMKSLEAELLKNTVSDLTKPNPDGSTSNYNVPGGGTDDKKTKKDPNSTLEEINRLKLENEAKYAELLLKQQRQFEDDRIAAMQDGYEKEMAIEAQRYNREIDDLDRQKVHTVELAKLDEDIAKAKESKDITKYKALLTIRKGWDKKNLALDEQINKIKEGKLYIHNLKVATIEEKAASESLKKSEDRFKREKDIRETNFINQLNSLKSLEEAKELLKGVLSAKELSRIKTLEEAKVLLGEKFKGDEEKREIEYLEGLLKKLDDIINSKQFDGIDLELLTPDQKDKFLKQIEEAKKLKAELDKAIKGGDSNASETPEEKEKRNQDSKKVFEGLNGGVDILGFTPEQWQQAYDNLDTYWGKFAAGAMALMAVQNAWGQYNQFLDDSENAQLKKFEKTSDAKKTKLKRQLDSGMITQKTYNKQVERIDKEVDKKKAEIEYKQAKRKKAMDIVNTVINTAVAIMQGYSQLGPIGGTIAAVLIGAMGALQIATIAKQPLPAKGYESGLYGDYVKRQQDGKVFKSRYAGKTRSGLVSDTSHFLVAENGPEMVIDNKAWRQMNPEVKDSLIRELNGIKGFEKGLYNPELRRYEVPKESNSPTPSGDNNQLLQMVLAVVSENTAVMKEIKESGILAIVSNKDLPSMKNLKEGIEAYTELRTKSKR